MPMKSVNNTNLNMIHFTQSQPKMIFQNKPNLKNICSYTNTMSPQKIRLYNPISDRLENVHPYTRKAKIIYRSYIEILDWSPDSFLPAGLQFKNNRFRLTQKTRTITPWKNRSKTVNNSALNNLVQTHEIVNIAQWQGFRGLDLIKYFKTNIVLYLISHSACKRQFVAELEFEKNENGVRMTETTYIRSKILAVTNAGEVDNSIQMAINVLKEKVEEVGHKMKGSGWIFKMVNKVEAQISQYVPLMGGSYIPTPPYLRSKGVVNVKNENDQKCFQWAI